MSEVRGNGGGNSPPGARKSDPPKAEILCTINPAEGGKILEIVLNNKKIAHQRLPRNFSMVFPPPLPPRPEDFVPPLRLEKLLPP